MEIIEDIENALVFPTSVGMKLAMDDATAASEPRFPPRAWGWTRANRIA